MSVISKMPVIKTGGSPAWYRAGGAPAPVAAYQAKGAASLAASYVNLANPGTYDCTLGSAPTLSGGWGFNGTSNYLKTGVVPSANSWSAVIQFSAAATPAGGTYAFGVLDGATTKFFGIAPTYATTDCLFANANLVQIAAGAKTSGNLAIAGAQGYYNGSTFGSAISQSGLNPAREIFIGCLNNSGSAGNYLAITIHALAIYNTTLTAGQVSAIATAMAAL